MYQTFGTHLEFLGARSNFQTGNPQTLGATVQSLVARSPAICAPHFNWLFLLPLSLPPSLVFYRTSGKHACVVL
jgi:hypothetical protein